MERIAFKCGGCGTTAKAPATMAGQVIACPKCKAQLRLPGSAVDVPPPAPTIDVTPRSLAVVPVRPPKASAPRGIGRGLAFTFSFAGIAVGFMAGFAVSEFAFESPASVAVTEAPDEADLSDAIDSDSAELTGEIYALTGEPLGELAGESEVGIGVTRKEITEALSQTYRLHIEKETDRQLIIELGGTAFIELIGPADNLEKISVIGSTKGHEITDPLRTLGAISRIVWRENKWFPEWMTVALQMAGSDYVISKEYNGVEVRVTAGEIGEIELLTVSFCKPAKDINP